MGCAVGTPGGGLGGGPVRGGGGGPGGAAVPVGGGSAARPSRPAAGSAPNQSPGGASGGRAGSGSRAADGAGRSPTGGRAAGGPGAASGSRSPAAGGAAVMPDSSLRPTGTVPGARPASSRAGPSGSPPTRDHGRPRLRVAFDHLGRVGLGVRPRHPRARSTLDAGPGWSLPSGPGHRRPLGPGSAESDPAHPHPDPAHLRPLGPGRPSLRNRVGLRLRARVVLGSGPVGAWASGPARPPAVDLGRPPRPTRPGWSAGPEGGQARREAGAPPGPAATPAGAGGSPGAGCWRPAVEARRPLPLGVLGRRRGRRRAPGPSRPSRRVPREPRGESGGWALAVVVGGR